MIKKLFFCEFCRKQLNDVNKIHYVEDQSDRGFCSEDCILEFYRPYMQALEDEEKSFRNSLNLADEEHYEILGNDHYLELALNNPTEVWQIENELLKKFYTHILELSVNGDLLFIILVCSYVDGAPSFVFYRTITGSPALVKQYQRDNQIEVTKGAEELLEDEQGKMDIAHEIMEQIEFKKSFLLAEMLEHRKPNDIEFEKFPEYDSFLEKTLNNPDEIYEVEDDEGDLLHTCIKSYQDGDSSFFYILIALPYKDHEADNNTIMVPILGFPSNDKSLYPKYAVGKRVDTTLSN